MMVPDRWIVVAARPSPTLGAWWTYSGQYWADAEERDSQLQAGAATWTDWRQTNVPSRWSMASQGSRRDPGPLGWQLAKGDKRW